MQDDIDEINAIIADISDRGGPTADDVINLALMVRHMRQLLDEAMGNK